MAEAHPSLQVKKRSVVLLFNCLQLVLLSALSAVPLFAAPNPSSIIPGAKAPAGQPAAAPTDGSAAVQQKGDAELSDAEIDALRQKYEARSAELRQQSDPKSLTALRSTKSDVATPQELDEWERLNSRLATILDDHSTVLFRYQNYRKGTKDKLAEMNSWKGFTEKPPYSLALVDGLRDALEVKQQVYKSLDLVRTTIESEFAENSALLKKGATELRLAEEGVEKSAGRPDEQRSRWLLQLAQLRNEVGQAGVLYSESRRHSAAELQKGVQAEIDFLNRKLAVARANYTFSDAELKKKQQAVNDQYDKARQKLEQAKNIEKEARQQLDTAEAAVVAAQTSLAAGKRIPVPLEQLQREQRRRQARFDDSALRVLVQSGIAQLLNSEKVLWEDRYLAAGGMGADGRRELLEQLKTRRNAQDLITKWKEYVANKLGVVEYQIRSQQDILASAASSAADREDARYFLGVYQEQEALLRHGIQFITEYEQLVLRRDEEVRLLNVSSTERARSVFGSIREQIGKVWETELYVAEDTVIVDGKKISRPRSVTIGKVVQAILILLVGLWGIRHVKGLMHWLATNRFKLGTNDAHLYTRLLAYLLFVIVLVSALVFVNIPLAIFTFMGGALAIGVGFGAQTLINNFISGIILMFDKTIRMGDMVEVDGHRGRVASIGMRGSRIKRFDGIEMTVPNSLFLQQNVINWTASDRQVRFTLSVGVAYGSPTREVERLICEAAIEQPQVLGEPRPYVVLDSFADNSLNFTAYFWIELDPDINSQEIISDIRHRIYERLAAAGIVIPFPQRDLHLSADRPLEVRINS